MKKAESFALIGGDMRQAYLGRLLAQDGNDVYVYGLERHGFGRIVKPETDIKLIMEQANVVVLPLPVLQDGKRLNAPLSNAPHKIVDILDNIPAKKLVLGGAVSKEVQEMAGNRGYNIIDYLEREELAILNAIPTALAI